MTRKRFDKHSTEFGLWLRERSEIDSGLGYVATNVDYVWHNYSTGLWMLIEEKRYGGEPTFSQLKTFEMLDDAIRRSGDKKYLGIHLLVFEKTSPEDGKMWLDGIPINMDTLISFLRFDFIPHRHIRHLGVFGCLAQDRPKRFDRRKK